MDTRFLEDIYSIFHNCRHSQWEGGREGRKEEGRKEKKEGKEGRKEGSKEKKEDPQALIQHTSLGKVCVS